MTVCTCRQILRAPWPASQSLGEFQASERPCLSNICSGLLASLLVNNWTQNIPYNQGLSDLGLHLL